MHPPIIPRPRSQDRLPFLTAFSLESTIIWREISRRLCAHLRSFRFKLKCLLLPYEPRGHQLAAISGHIPTGIPLPPTQAGWGICAMCAFQRYGWKVMAVGKLFIYYGLGDWKDSRLALRPGKKKIHKGQEMQDRSEGRGKDFWWIYNPQLNDWQSCLVHLNHPLWRLSFIN